MGIWVSLDFQAGGLNIVTRLISKPLWSFDFWSGWIHVCADSAKFLWLSGQKSSSALFYSIVVTRLLVTNFLFLFSPWSLGSRCLHACADSAKYSRVFIFLSAPPSHGIWILAPCQSIGISLLNFFEVAIGQLIFSKNKFMKMSNCVKVCFWAPLRSRPPSCVLRSGSSTLRRNVQC